MTAIKLSDQPTVTTVNKELIPLVSETGAVFQISVANLAKAMREAFPAATTIGADDKIPISQGGVDKLLPFQVLSKELNKVNRIIVAAGATMSVLVEIYAAHYLIWIPSKSMHCDLFSNSNMSLSVSIDNLSRFISYHPSSVADVDGKLNVVVSSDGSVLLKNKTTAEMVVYLKQA